MKKLSMILVLIFMIALSSCDKDGVDKIESETKSDETILETEVEETESQPRPAETDIADNNMSEIDNELSDEMAVGIAKNCSYTISAQFNETDVVPYSDIFYYYTYDACYTPDRKGIPMSIVHYFDNKKMSFSIPYKIADAFLAKRFNTEPDRFSVPYYNAETECYEFIQNSGERYCDYTLREKEKIADNKYGFTVEVKHRLTDTIPVENHKFTIEINGDDYKILSRKIEVVE